LLVSGRDTRFSSLWWKERFSDEDLALFSKLKNLVTKARLRTKEFDPDVDWEYLFDIWCNQNGKCIYSGLPLSTEINHPHTISLDRKDSKQGYVKGNLQLVSASVNRMKQEFSEEFFLSLCEKITNNKSEITQE
jgi:hypothetical protein